MLYCCKVSCFGEVTYDCSLLCRGALVVGVAVVKTLPICSAYRFGEFWWFTDEFARENWQKWLQQRVGVIERVAVLV